MNPLETIKLENFQSHVSTTIEPAPPGELTVIVGPSDSGKTAILRGLRWLFNDEPQGADFIRAGTDFARVTAQYEGPEGKTDTVVRYRTSGGTNRYLVNGEKFEGFGKTGVPLEVSQITGVRPVTIGDLELNLNIAEQLAGPFLGSSVSAPARAKVLGKLAGTEEIDHAGKTLGTDLYRRGQDEKRLAAELVELEEKIKGYDWLPNAALLIETLEGIAAQVRAAQAKREKVARLRETCVVINEKIRAAYGIMHRWRGLEEAEAAVRQAAQQAQDQDMYAKLAARYWDAQKGVWASEKVLDRLQGLDGAEEALRSVQDGTERVKRLEILKTSYVDNAGVIYRCKAVIHKLQGLDTAELLMQQTETKRQRRERLEELALSYGKTGMFITQEKVKVESLRQVSEAETFSHAISEKRDCRGELVSLRDKYAGVINHTNKAREQAVLWENRVAELEGAYHDLLEDLQVCPLCGQEIRTEIMLELKLKVKEAV